MRISCWRSDVCSSDLEIVGEARHPGHVEMGGGRDPLGPYARIVDRRGHQPPHRIIIVGVDEQRAVMLVDIIFAPRLARGDEDRRGGGVARGNEPHFVRSEERRVGKVWVSTFSSWWSPYH